MERALHWWSRRPLWQCSLAWLAGLSLLGTGPIAFLLVSFMCLFPPVHQKLEGEHPWQQFKRDLENAWRWCGKQLREPQPAAEPAQAQAGEPEAQTVVIEIPRSGRQVNVRAKDVATTPPAEAAPRTRSSRTGVSL